MIKQVKYRVTNALGELRVGEIVDAKLLLEDMDGNRALLHISPSDDICSGCVILCKKVMGVYEDLNENAYINCSVDDDERCKMFARTFE